MRNYINNTLESSFSGVSKPILQVFCSIIFFGSTRSAHFCIVPLGIPTFTPLQTQKLANCINLFDNLFKNLDDIWPSLITIYHIPATSLKKCQMSPAFDKLVLILRYTFLFSYFLLDGNFYIVSTVIYPQI